jgi:hypothetical protein
MFVINHAEVIKMGKKMEIKKGSLMMIMLGIVAFSALLTSANLFYTITLSGTVQEQSLQLTDFRDYLEGIRTSEPTTTNADDQQIIAQIADEVIPKGTPAVYGEELSVQFSEVQDSINKISVFDEGIELDGTDKERYINITTSISCEYCCSAPYITAPTGEPACGCAHSAAMRGLAKYLIQNHGGEFTDSQILDELAKWKAVYFPKQTIEKAIKLRAEEGEISPSLLATLPDMVGGC